MQTALIRGFIKHLSPPQLSYLCQSLIIINIAFQRTSFKEIHRDSNSILQTSNSWRENFKLSIHGILARIQLQSYSAINEWPNSRSITWVWPSSSGLPCFIILARIRQYPSSHQLSQMIQFDTKKERERRPTQPEAYAT